MDRFSAHMDRSWDLINTGDMTAALVAARQALALDVEAPEVHNLMGYIHAIEGDFEVALECYKRAIDLDEWYLEPILNAAELQAHPDADPDEAVRLCRRASEMMLEPEELADALLIEVDALLNAGREAEAAARLEELESVEALPAFYQVIVARAFFESGELARARTVVERVLRQDPSSPDAWYCLGLVERESGRRLQAVRAFLETRTRDLMLPRLPWRKTNEEILEACAKVMAELDDERAGLLEGTELVVEDCPTEELIAMEVDPRQVVLAQRIDSSRGAFGKLWVFSLNLERVVAPTTFDDDFASAVANELQGKGS